MISISSAFEVFYCPRILFEFRYFISLMNSMHFLLFLTIMCSHENPLFIFKLLVWWSLWTWRVNDDEGTMEIKFCESQFGFYSQLPGLSKVLPDVRKCEQICEGPENRSRKCSAGPSTCVVFHGCPTSPSVRHAS